MTIRLIFFCLSLMMMLWIAGCREQSAAPSVANATQARSPQQRRHQKGQTITFQQMRQRSNGEFVLRADLRPPLVRHAKLPYSGDAMLLKMGRHAIWVQLSHLLRRIIHLNDHAKKTASPGKSQRTHTITAIPPQRVCALSAGRFATHHKRGANTTQVAAPLLRHLRALLAREKKLQARHKQTQKRATELAVIPDSRTPLTTLKLVMQTAKEAGFSRIRLVVCAAQKQNTCTLRTLALLPPKPEVDLFDTLNTNMDKGFAGLDRDLGKLLGRKPVVAAPKAKTPPRRRKPPKPPKPPLFSVVFDAKGITVFHQKKKQKQRALPAGCDLRPEALEEQRTTPTFPTNRAGRYPLSHLSGCLQKLKKIFPDEQRLLLHITPNIDVQALASMLAACTYTQKGAPLYPKVQLAP